jgi:hypothetical protein
LSLDSAKLNYPATTKKKRREYKLFFVPKVGMNYYEGLNRFVPQNMVSSLGSDMEHHALYKSTEQRFVECLLLAQI